MMPERLTYRLGWACVGFFAVHALVQTLSGTPYNLLWACHIACLLVGVGLLLRWRTLVKAGLLLLFLGTPLWLINLLAGGAFYPTSVLTHFGGLIGGWSGLCTMRRPHAWAGASHVKRAASAQVWRQGWLLATACVAALLIASRALTLPSANVNLVFKSWWAPAGWSLNDEAYVVALWATATGCLWISSQALKPLTRLELRNALPQSTAARFAGFSKRLRTAAGRQALTAVVRRMRKPGRAV